jgi:preprotein translocase subunit SecG
MLILITVVHVIVSLFLVVVVLLQSGKAADLAGAFGGMGSQTVFGPRGSATVLTRATTISAILFMVTSLTLSVMSTGAGPAPSILDEITAPATSEAPATGEGTAPATTPATPKELEVSTQVEGGAKQTQKIPIPPPPGETAPKQ